MKTATMKTTHNHKEDGANQNPLLHPRANLPNHPRATEANLVLDPVHLMSKVVVIVAPSKTAAAKEIKHKQNHSMPKNGNKNSPHKPKKQSPPTFA